MRLRRFGVVVVSLACAACVLPEARTDGAASSGGGGASSSTAATTSTSSTSTAAAGGGGNGGESACPDARRFTTTNSEDTFMQAADAGSNFGGGLTFFVDGMAGAEKHALLRFDLVTLAGVSQVCSVAVSLAVSNVPQGGDVTVAFHPVTKHWSELAATWNEAELGEPWGMPGGDFGPAVGSHVVPSDTPAGGILTFVLGADDPNFRDPVGQNHGWLLKVSEESASTVFVGFHSRQAPQTSDSPSITVDFAP